MDRFSNFQKETKDTKRPAWLQQATAGAAREPSPPGRSFKMLDPSRAHEETVDEPEEMEEDDLVGEEVWSLITKLLVTKAMVLSHIFHFCLHCNSETLIFFFHFKESVHALVIHNAHRILGYSQRQGHR